jgi:hypothetical protein
VRISNLGNCTIDEISVRVKSPDARRVAPRYGGTIDRDDIAHHGSPAAMAWQSQPHGAASAGADGRRTALVVHEKVPDGAPMKDSSRASRSMVAPSLTMISERQGGMSAAAREHWLRRQHSLHSRDGPQRSYARPRRAAEQAAVTHGFVEVRPACITGKFRRAHRRRPHERKPRVWRPRCSFRKPRWLRRPSSRNASSLPARTSPGAQVEPRAVGAVAAVASGGPLFGMYFGQHADARTVASRAFAAGALVRPMTADRPHRCQAPRRDARPGWCRLPVVRCGSPSRSPSRR